MQLVETWLATSLLPAFQTMSRETLQATSLRCRFHLLRRLQHFFDWALHVESLFRDVVVLAFHDCLEAFYGVGNFHISSRGPGKLFGHVEGLRQETLDLASASNRQLLILAQFVDAENSDDILQIF